MARSAQPSHHIATQLRSELILYNPHNVTLFPVNHCSYTLRGTATATAHVDGGGVILLPVVVVIQFDVAVQEC